MDLFELAAIAKRGGKGGSGGSSTSSDTELLSPIKGAVSGKNVRIQDSLNKGISGVRIFGKTTQAATPSPENPQDMMAVGADGDIEVMLTGDNLIQFPYFDDSETSAGVTFTVNDDTSISLNGTSTSRTSFTFDLFKVEKGTYTLSARGNGSGPLLRVLDQSKRGICAEMLLDGTDNKTITFTITEPRSEIQVYLSVDGPDIICSGTVLPALTKGQSITIPTPNGLRGIPVLENGTYTDESGQQWICDEVDLERGVYVQRICEHVIDGSEKKGDLDGDMHSGPSTAISFMFNDIAMSNGFTPTCLCNQLPYVQGCWSILDAVGCGTKLDNVFLRIPNDIANISDEGLEPPDAMDARFSQIWYHVRYQYQHGNPYVIQYVLIEPIETPISLSEEDLAAFKDMCNDKCIVNISNDADTHMAITYAVDTQEYLEANYVSKEEYEALADKYVSKEEYDALAANTASPIRVTIFGTEGCIFDGSDNGFSGMRIFGKTEQAVVPSPDQPAELVSVGSNGNVDVLVKSTNLFDPDHLMFGAVKTKDLPYKPKVEDGLFYTGGVEIDTSVLGCAILVPLPTMDDCTIYVSGESIGDTIKYMPSKCEGVDGTGVYTSYGDLLARPYEMDPGPFNYQFEIRGGWGYTHFCFFAYTKEQYSGIIKNLMISAVPSSVYQPYYRGELAISTPNGLPGIPVTEAGNYTDESGQQWICDEIDLERGKYTKRIGSYTLTGNENFRENDIPNKNGKYFSCGVPGAESYMKSRILCDRFPSGNPTTELEDAVAIQYGGLSIRLNAANDDVNTLKQWLRDNPTTIQYILATPVETPLADETIEAYRGLHTTRLITDISSNADAYMQIVYTADTQKHIEDNYVSKEEYEALDINLASAIKPVASGSAITLRDSADKKLSGMRIFGKTMQKTTTGAQLWDNEKAKDPTFWIVESGLSYAYADFTLKPNTTYTISMVANNMSIDNPNLTNTYAFYIGERKGTYENNTMIGNTGADIGKTKYTFTTTENQMYFNVYPKNVSTETLTLIFEELLQNIMLNEGSTPLPYEPYTGGQPSPNPEYPQEMVSVGESGNVEVAVTGKNLFDISKVETTGSPGSLAVINNGDGSITVYANASSSTFPCKLLKNLCDGLVVGRKYTLSGDSTGSWKHIYLGAPASIMWDYGETKIVTEEMLNSTVYFYASGVSSTATIKNIQLELGDTATSYEPYTAQSLTLSTPNGLPGVPVFADGNYTDENGQQWICDEIDLERGVYVKRVEIHAFNDNDTFTMETRLSDMFNRFSWVNYINIAKIETPVICEIMRFTGFRQVVEENIIHGASGNARCFIFVSKEIDTVEKFKDRVRGTKIQYILATPIETPLSDQELATYRTLHTNYPTTNIFNDANVHMEVTYTADTENHIETNYVPKSDYEALEARVAALEQNALSV